MTKSGGVLCGEVFRGARQNAPSVLIVDILRSSACVYKCYKTSNNLQFPKLSCPPVSEALIGSPQEAVETNDFNVNSRNRPLFPPTMSFRVQVCRDLVFPRFHTKKTPKVHFHKSPTQGFAHEQNKNDVILTSSCVYPSGCKQVERTRDRKTQTQGIELCGKSSFGPHCTLCARTPRYICHART